MTVDFLTVVTDGTAWIFGNLELWINVTSETTGIFCWTSEMSGTSWTPCCVLIVG